MLKNNSIGIIALIGVGILFWLVLDLKKQTKPNVFIDLPYVFNEFALKKDLQKKYTNVMAGRKKNIDSLGFFLQNLEAELKSESKPDQEKVKLFLNKQKVYMEQVKIFDEEDKSINSDYDAQIFKQLNQYVTDYGKENNINIIFGSMGNGSLMYADSTINITNKIVIYINKKYAGTSTK